MIINKLSTNLLIHSRILARFSGGHHHEVYDWRDDHTKNPDFYQDPRMIGVRKSSTFVTPFRAQPNQIPTYLLSHPKEYNPKDLSTNYVGTLHFQGLTNNIQLPSNDYIADAAHEFDYESQDLDFQAQSFQTQHFRKQGPLWMWVIVGLTPLWFFANELFVQYWPDSDNWRYQRPPPYNWPNVQQSPDDDTLKLFKSKQHQELYDAGIANPPFFDIIDGKKVYTKWAGVNQPREVF